MKIRAIIKVLLSTILWSSFSYSATSEWGEKTITANDIPAVLDSLRKTGSDGSFVVFLIPGTSILDGHDANIQFSIEDGVLGLDWVMLAQRNRTDKARVSNIANEFGARCNEKNQNNVSYIRCVGEVNYSDLAIELLLNLYKLSNRQKFPAIYESFSWPKPNKNRQQDAAVAAPLL